VNTYLGSPILPAPRFPVVFHSVNGRDQREGSSPSYFNIDEVTQVKEYVKRLKDELGTRAYCLLSSTLICFVSFGLSGNEDIGIISPYQGQCQRLRRALKALDSDGIKIGSVEEFQGQVRQIHKPQEDAT